MTEKQKRFCDEYLIDLNGTRAYKAAYPSVKDDDVGARSASRMLKNVKVRAYLDERLEQLHSERTADAQEVVEFLTTVMRDEKKGDVPRLKAAELIGKHLGMFTDKVNVSGNIPVVICGEHDLPE